MRNLSQPSQIAYDSGAGGKPAHTLPQGRPSFSMNFMLRSF